MACASSLWWNYEKETVGDGIKTPREKKGKGRVSPAKFMEGLEKRSIS